MTPRTYGVFRLLPRELKADCANCAALCCSAYEFNYELGYPFTKAADTSCALLRADHRCSIHERREVHGLHSCVNYECYGAGQWITREFGGERSTELYERFRLVRSLHETLASIVIALEHVFNDTDRTALIAVQHELEALRSKPLKEMRSTFATRVRSTAQVIRNALNPRLP